MSQTPWSKLQYVQCTLRISRQSEDKMQSGFSPCKSRSTVSLISLILQVFFLSNERIKKLTNYRNLNEGHG